MLVGPFRAADRDLRPPPFPLLTPAEVELAPQSSPGWRDILVQGHADGSHYDHLVALAREGHTLPDGVVCLAGSGSGFRGFRGRSWVAAPGNIHLTAVLAPGRPVPGAGSIFTVLAANALVEALDGVEGLQGRAGIKWVNDILVDDRKVGGALAWTQSRGEEITTAIVGIGLNVECTPPVERSPWVPEAGCLNDVVSPPSSVPVDEVVRRLLLALHRHYELLLSEGAGPATERYRSRSVVLGREVVLREDRDDGPGALLAAGRVDALGDALELYLSGHPTPITRGRLQWAHRGEGAGRPQRLHTSDEPA